MKMAQTQGCLVCLNEHVYTVTMVYTNLSVSISMHVLRTIVRVFTLVPPKIGVRFKYC